MWVVDFPMFEWDEEAKRWNAMHHPFTAPLDGHEDFLDTDPGKAYAKAHDMVLNGWEIGGGSVRIHRQDVQSKVFRALKINAEDAARIRQGVSALPEEQRLVVEMRFFAEASLDEIASTLGCPLGTVKVTSVE